MASRGYLSFAEVREATGIDKWRLGAVVKRTGVRVYRTERDRRGKYIRRGDLAKLTAFRPDRSPSPPPSWVVEE
jgi:hypothetical protein